MRQSLRPRVRALIVTNMYPSRERPALGSFVRDQVRALERIGGLELELFTFAPGGLGAYARAGVQLRRRYAGRRFDIVHAHFGLTAWPALAVAADAHVVTLHGTDVMHPRSRLVTLAALRRQQLVATVSEELAAELPGWAVGGEVAVLPCGVDMRRFRPLSREQARGALGLDPDRPHLLFPADPRRPEKRYDLAVQLAGEVPLLALGDVDPEQVPLWVNAANAVVIPSSRESFGLAVLEALSCDVPVLSTRHGIAPTVLSELDGAYCAEFELEPWRRALAPHLETSDPRISGRVRAEPYSSDLMAARVISAWRALLRAEAPAAQGGRRGAATN